jgi:hypothetical protein
MNLDLDFDLVCHMADQDSWRVIRTEQFSDRLLEEPIAQNIFRWQSQHYAENGFPATRAVLEDEFEGLEIEEPKTAIRDLISRLRRRYVRNQGQEVIETLADTLVSDPFDVAKKLLQEGRTMADLTVNRGESYGRGDHDALIQEYDLRATKGRGPGFGFNEVDDHFFGQQNLTFLIGAPKMYKSWFAVNAVIANINYGEFPYLYSLELPAADTSWRVKCMMANIPPWKYLKGGLSGEDRKALAKVADEEVGNYRIEKPRFGERSAVQLVERAINAGANCLFIDQLQYVETSDGRSLGARNDPGEYWEVCNEFRDYSDDIPIFVIHQFNRSVMNSDTMPEMQQVKGSSAIEETGSLVLGLYANKDMRASNVVELGTLASRHFSHASWEIGIELSRGCKLMMNGRIEE